MESQFNNTKQYLGSQETWSGSPEVTTGFSNVAVNIVSNHNLSVQVYQSLDGRTFDFRDDYLFNTSIVGTQTTFQTGIKALYYKVVVTNISVNNIDNLVITSTFFNTSRDSSLLQPDIIAGSVSVLNSIKATDYTFNIPRNVACDSSGHLLVSASTPSGTQDVNILSSVNLSVTPPHLSYLTDNISVTNQPALTFATDKVDITGSSVLTTEKVTQVGSRGNLQVATFNPLAQTNIFNCTGYGEATLTYEDTSPANTGDMLIFVRVNNLADTQVCIGKLIPIVNANGTNRYASTTLNLRAFNFIYVQNNSTTNTNTNCVISLFSY